MVTNFAKLGFALIMAAAPAASAGSPDNRDLVSVPVFQRIIERNSCPMITEDDRRNLNKSYREILEKAEDDKLPAICDRAIEDLESSRRMMTDAIAVNDAERTERGMSEIFGSETAGGKLEFALRVCPSGATKLEKILLGVEIGIGLAQLAFPQAALFQYAKIGIDSFQAAQDVRENGLGVKNSANLGVTFGKYFFRPLGHISKIRKGYNVFTWFRGRGKNHQFVDKMVACQTNRIVKSETEEACSNPLEADDLTVLRDAYLRLAGNRSNQNAAGFCKQTACLWSFGARRTDERWRETMEQRFASLPPPERAQYDSKGRAIDYERELRDALEKVDDWRDKCSKISEYVVSCEVSCRQGPGKAIPAAQPSGGSAARGSR